MQIEINDEGKWAPRLQVLAVVPCDFPQTAAAGEFFGLLVADWYVNEQAAGDGDGSIVIAADCNAVIKSLRFPVWAKGPARPYAGICSQLRHAQQLVGLKMTAHQKVQPHWTCEQTRCFWENHFADVAAKKAAASLVVPSAELMALIQRKKFIGDILMWAAQVLTAFPSLKELITAGALCAYSPRRAPAKTSHRWEWNQGMARWWCPGCLKTSQKGGRQGVCLKWAAAGAAQLAAWTLLRHRLSWATIKAKEGPGATSTPLPILVFCMSCGAYCQYGHKGRLLEAQCKREASSQHSRIKRIVAGAHPADKSKRLGKVNAIRYIPKTTAADPTAVPEEGETEETPPPAAELASAAELLEEASDAEEARRMWGDDFWQG